MLWFGIRVILSDVIKLFNVKIQVRLIGVLMEKMSIRNYLPVQRFILHIVNLMIGRSKPIVWKKILMSNKG